MPPACIALRVTHCWMLVRVYLQYSVTFYMLDRTMQMALHASSSDSVHMVSGVPYGNVLDPLLFALCIKDVIDVIQNSIFKYIDDSMMVKV